MTDEDKHLRDPAQWYIKEEDRDKAFRYTERPTVGWTDWRAIYGTRITLWYKFRCWLRDELRPRLRVLRRKVGL